MDGHHLLVNQMITHLNNELIADEQQQVAVSQQNNVPQVTQSTTNNCLIPSVPVNGNQPVQHLRGIIFC